MRRKRKFRPVDPITNKIIKMVDFDYKSYCFADMHTLNIESEGLIEFDEYVCDCADNSGKMVELFENDIIAFRTVAGLSKPYVVEFDNVGEKYTHGFRFSRNRGYKNSYPIDSDSLMKAVKVGNRYDNPELYIELMGKQ